MKERKNLENLFQESFENFEAIPPENAWENIELKLKEKKNKKRIIPLWWKLSGIAALFVLGFFIQNSVYNDGISTDNPVVNQENNSEKNNNPKSNINSKKENENDAFKNLEIDNANEAVVSNDSNLGETDKNSIPNSDNSVADVSKNTPKNLKNNNSNKAVVTNNLGEIDKSSIPNSGNSVADVSKNTPNNLKNKSKFQESNSEKELSNVDSEISRKNVADNQKNTNSKTIFSNNKFNNNTIIGSEKIENSIVSNPKLNNSKTIFSENNSENNQKSIISESAKANFINSINSQKSIVNKENNTIIEEKITKKDSTKIAVVEPNALEELLKEKENKTIIVEQKLNRWQVSTNVAPIYFSSAGNGSPLDSEFKNNSKSYNTNLSYGMGVNYAVNKKLKIRTSVNKLSIDYTTNDVVFFQNNNASRIEHVNTNTQGSVIQLESKNNRTENEVIINDGSYVMKKFDSSLNQKFGYIEVPVEMSYSIINKKFGIDVIGGLSTLFLNENEVAIVASGVNMNIGEANNLNDVHFSGNLGLGFKYGIFKNLEARVEPVFKYQMNTFSSDDGNFKPYVFGVYSGITYTF